MNPSVTQPVMPRVSMDVRRPLQMPPPRQARVSGARPVTMPAAAVPAAAQPAPNLHPAAAPRVQSPPVPQAATTTSIVGDIPLKAPAQPFPVKEDDELDRIMQDVGKELKQADRAHTKKRLSLFGRKKHQPAVSRSVPVMAKIVDVQPAAQPQTGLAHAATVRKPVPATGKIRHNQPAPVGVVLATFLVTGFLIAATFYAYK